MSERFDPLDLVTDGEMEAIVHQYGMAHGMQEVFRLAIERAMEKETQHLKLHLDEQFYGNRIPQEAKDYINLARAKFIMANNGKTMQMAGEDDRLGENMDNALIHLGYWQEGSDIQASVKKLTDDMIQDGEGHMSVASIFMRTIPETLKILIYYLKIKSIADVKKFVDGYVAWLSKMGIVHDENGKRKIDQDNEDRHTNLSLAKYTSIHGHNSHFSRHFDEIIRDFSTVSEDISARGMLGYIRKFGIADMDTFIDFLFGEMYTYGFIFLADGILVEYFLDNNAIHSLSGFKEFIRDKETRETLVRYSASGASVKNTIKFLRRFQITDVRELNAFDKGIQESLTKAKPGNLDILFGVFGIDSMEEFFRFSQNEVVQRNIEQTEYSHLWDVIWTEGLFEGSHDEKRQLFFDIVSKKYDRELSEGLAKLPGIIKNLSKNHTGLGKFLRGALTGDDISENIDSFIRTVGSLQGQAGEGLDFSRLDDLRLFMGGAITPLLAKEILTTQDAGSLFASWQEVIKGFEGGEFDAKNPLHQNLEYKKFREMSQDEALRKYMGNRFRIDDFLSIFRDQWSRTGGLLSSEEGDFEIQCLLYEAGILRDTILSLNEQAKQAGKKLLILPNLSYGYLPVSAIADELSDPNIEVYYGVKVGSTAAHHDREVIDSALFAPLRERILQEQPIIVVVDGTANIRTGNVRNIKYPDAYEGFLNQAIALNFLAGLDDPEKVDYSYCGKSTENLKDLFADPEFQRTVEIYKQSSTGAITPYRFLFYNTAGMDLTIRDGDADTGKRLPRPFSPRDVGKSSMIFCNVGVLHDDLPLALKNGPHKHTPAYFDDTGAIISLEYTYNEYGLQVSNPIEQRIAELKTGKTLPIRPNILKQISGK